MRVKYAWLSLVSILITTQVIAETKPTLWGYGVKSCGDYVSMWLGIEKGQPEAIAAYQRYQDWLSGFISGINTAVNMDILAGVTIDGAMRRIYIYCDDHHKGDIYTATRELVRQLNAVDISP